MTADPARLEAERELGEDEWVQLRLVEPLTGFTSEQAEASWIACNDCGESALVLDDELAGWAAEHREECL